MFSYVEYKHTAASIGVYKVMKHFEMIKLVIMRLRSVSGKQEM